MSFYSMPKIIYNTGISKIYIESVYEKFKYLCNLCEFKDPQMGNLKIYIESVHEKIKCPCNQCEYKATGKGHLKTHIESVNVKVKYHCNENERHREIKSNITEEIPYLSVDHSPPSIPGKPNNFPANQINVRFRFFEFTSVHWNGIDGGGGWWEVERRLPNSD